MPKLLPYTFRLSKVDPTINVGAARIVLERTHYAPSARHDATHRRNDKAKIGSFGNRLNPPFYLIKTAIPPGIQPKFDPSLATDRLTFFNREAPGNG